MNATPAEIKKQYNRAKVNGWLPLIERATLAFAPADGVTPAFMLALGSRETNLDPKYQRIAGDRGHGFSMWQLDIGSHKAWIQTGAWKDVDQAVNKAAKSFIEKARQVEQGQGKTLTVRGRKFVGAKVDRADIRRIATAAYNSGLWGYYHFSKGNNVDTTTTGKDYSRDVYDRSIEFAKLLEADGDAGALQREIQLQGKYARGVDAKRVGRSKTDKIEDSVDVEPAAHPSAAHEEGGSASPPMTAPPSSEPPKEEAKPANTTSSNQEAGNTEGTPPPVPAQEIVASRPSLKSAAATVVTFLMAPLTLFGIDTSAFASRAGELVQNNTALAIKLAIGFGFAVLAVYLWSRAMDRANQRTLKVMDAAADKDKNNLRLIAAKDA